jgi:hypothetical protein
MRSVKQKHRSHPFKTEERQATLITAYNFFLQKGLSKKQIGFGNPYFYWDNKGHRDKTLVLGVSAYDSDFEALFQSFIEKGVAVLNRGKPTQHTQPLGLCNLILSSYLPNDNDRYKWSCCVYLCWIWSSGEY